MAKKTNKTDHVLNLISSGNTKHNGDSSEDGGSQTPPPVDPLANNNPQVSIVQSSAREEKAVADTIRDSLEKELEEAAPQKSKKRSHEREAAEFTETPDTKEVIRDKNETLPMEEPADEVAVVSEPEAEEKKTESNNSKPKQAVTEQQTEPIQEPDVYENRFRKELEERIKEPAPEFTFVNVMEYLVRDKVITYMEQFGNCTCSRCVEDTAALTLTHLPAKYVVVNKNAISPLLDYYGHKYAGQITVEITKACIKVNKFPHHERE